MSRVVLYPYKMSSESCKALAQGLRDSGTEVLRVYPDKLYHPRDDDLIINWGNSTVPNWGGVDFNTIESVGLAINKLTALETLEANDVATPYFWTTKEEAKAAQRAKGVTIFARTILNGHSGQGIFVIKSDQELPNAPLYVAAFPKEKEYRVHVFNGEILDVQEKRKRRGTGDSSRGDIWNHSTGFVFCRENTHLPYNAERQAIYAVESLGLTFGAVDIGVIESNEEYEGEAVVFEVNTAPGLTGTTLTKYVEKFNEYI